MAQFKQQVVAVVDGAESIICCVLCFFVTAVDALISRTAGAAGAVHVLFVSTATSAKDCGYGGTRNVFTQRSGSEQLRMREQIQNLLRQEGAASAVSAYHRISTFFFF